MMVLSLVSDQIVIIRSNLVLTSILDQVLDQTLVLDFSLTLNLSET